MSDNFHKLGTRYGFGSHVEESEPTPVDNVLAISAWHSALSRMIAYTWKNWDNDQELDYIVKFPEYYLAKFGFFPQIPAYQTKVRFVIRKGDSVTFTHGDRNAGGTISATVAGEPETQQIVEQLQPCPDYISNNPDFQTSSNIESVTSICGDCEQPPSDEEIKNKLVEMLGLDGHTDGSDLPPLHNGWQFKDMSELTGCFIVTIPPKPDLSHIDNESQKSMVESQAISDFMDICRSQPFTSC
ncbi:MULTISPECIES: hypothetical protein [Pseudoalteromonas]|uniref:hypothetical protein n=1 Tax=Pseudoalteromonas TaxID=53246 RepID=UPI000F766298|nr:MULTISPECIES: hypothetical protein [Pseudoalteromonas]MCG7561190.1 hypothetical protein [Pseudoalteromonas sp. McH1-42]MCO7188984.1 hypothetical protein [Pseudoalteromonas sp. XMcav2-N]